MKWLQLSTGMSAVPNWPRNVSGLVENLPPPAVPSAEEPMERGRTASFKP